LGQRRTEVRRNPRSGSLIERIYFTGRMIGYATRNLALAPNLDERPSLWND
jgi:hypothetical protein